MCFFHRCLLLLLMTLLSLSSARAGGGLVLEEDKCILWIDFYSAHFTAYQPATQGNQQFCGDLPDVGETIIVLDYLHPSLKEVPVDFRIIRDVTGQGQYVKLKHVEALGDLDPYTVFYQPPVIRSDASFQIEHAFTEKGAYVAVVSAGHPSTDMIYTAVFPFQAGAFRLPLPLPALLLLLAGAGLLVWLAMRSRRKPSGTGAAS